LDTLQENGWLSLSDAAELLGVHPSTVRTWSNNGDIPVHRTQGGHRRYRRSEIELWAQTARQSRPVEADRIIQSAVSQVRVQIADGRLEAEPWYQKMDDDARSQYRRSAYTLFQGLLAYLASDAEDEAASEAYAIGYEYASRARRYSLSHVDAARAFLFFRNILLESLMKVYREANVPSGKAWEEMLHKMHGFTDQILLKLLETYQVLDEAKQ
jgi:excisionase family DNA binding protein